VLAPLADRGVDHQLDLLVLDRVHDVGPALVHLEDPLDLHALLGQELLGPPCGQDLEAERTEGLGRIHDRLALVRLGHGDQDRPRGGQGLLGGLLGLVEGQAVGVGHAQDLARGSHLRSQNGIDLREHVERKDRLLDAEIGDPPGLELQIRQLLAQHELGADPGHGQAADLGHQGHRSGGPRIGLQNIDLALGNGILDVDQAHHVQTQRDLPGVGGDRVQVLLRDRDRRDHAGRVARMDAGQLDVLHHRRDEGLAPVAQGVRLTLGGVDQELVDEDGSVGRDIHGRSHVLGQFFIVVDHLHAPPAQDEGRPDHEGIPDPMGHIHRLVEGAGHARLGHGDVQLLHHGPELVPVLCEVDRLGRGAQEPDPRALQLLGQVQRRLAAELDDHTLGPLLLVDAQDVLCSQGLEVELVRGVVVRGHGLRVAVDHDGLQTLFPQGEGRVHAAVVELDALADPVGTSAQDHDLAAVRDGDLVRRVVGRVVVGRVLHTADRDRLPGLDHAEPDPLLAQGVLLEAQDLGQVPVCEPVLLGPDQERVGGRLALVLQELLLQGDQLLHLLDEPGLDVGLGVQLLHVGPLAQGFIQDELTLARRHADQAHQVRQGKLVEVLGEAEAVAAVLQGPDRLLEGLLVRLADAHHLADRTHLGAQPVLDPLELLKGPPRELDHHIVPGRGVLVQGPVPPVGDLVQGQACGQLGRDQGDREARGLGGQGRGPRRAGIDLDDHHPVRLGVMRELDVRAADDLNGVHDGVGVLLQPGLELGIDGQHGGRAVRIACVDPHGVHVLDKADRDLPALGVPHHLQLQLLPAQDRLLDQELADQAGGQAPARDHLELVHVVDQASARPAHGVGGPDNHRKAQLLGDPLCLLHGIGRLALRHGNAEPLHGLLELDPVLAPLDGVHLHPDHLDAILLEHPCLVQLGGQVQAGLTAQVRQEGVRALLLDDPGHDG